MAVRRRRNINCLLSFGLRRRRKRTWPVGNRFTGSLSGFSVFRMTADFLSSGRQRCAFERGLAQGPGDTQLQDSIMEEGGHGGEFSIRWEREVANERSRGTLDV